MKRLFASTFILPILISCGASSVETKKAKVDSVKTVKEVKFNREWKYEEREDKMTSKKMSVAVLPAIKDLDLDFPYKGATPYIGLIHKNNKSAAILSVSTGQFMASSISHENVNARFDNAQAESYTGLASSDGDSKQLIIFESKKFIDNLKHSKKVIIEAEMYQNGLQQMEFNCEGLQWDH